MRLLLDTHALIWWLAGGAALSKAALDAIGNPDNDVCVSAVSAFEVTTKYRIGKLSEAAILALNFEREVSAEGFLPLGVGLADGVLAGALAFEHRDPFDRLLIAQALNGSLTLVSNERGFDQTGVIRLW